MTGKHVNAVVYEMSKNSSFFKNEQRNDERTRAQVETMRRRLAALRPADIARARTKMAKRDLALERGRNLARVWVVVDMDQFFAAVALRDDPSLRGKPVAVGGMGMIATASYEARKFGVRSAMPGFIGKKLCPQLVFVRPDFSKY